MDVPARALGEPVADQLGLVGAVVVHDEMNVEIGRHVALDLVEELAELARAMAREALADDLAGRHVERGEQRGRAVALVVVGAPLGLAGPHRQQRLGAVQRLDLALLVDAQHHGAVGRVEIEPDDVAHLLDEQRIGRELEGLAAVRLQPEGPPDAMDRRGRMADAAAMARRLQCVAPGGRVSSVRRIVSAIASSPIRRGAPGRGSS